ncbi:MAG: hypothetical protein WCJ30_15345 [Deltaproteobacteria bacterium]
MTPRCLPLLFAFALLPACSQRPVDPPADSGSDSGLDSGADEGTDASADAAHEANLEAGTDALPEAAPDASPDAVDAGPDVPDAPSDVTVATDLFGPSPTSTLTGPSGSFRFGASVAITRDGTTLAIGDWYSGGSVHLFVRSGSAFPGTPALTLRGPSGSSAFGTSVAFSQDGNTLVVGDTNFHGSSNRGGVHLYARSGATFSATPFQTVAEPFGGTTFTTNDFGSSVAFSPDGTVLVVGDYSYGSSALGGVHLFARSGSTFATLPFQTLAGPAQSAKFGSSVAVSQDGSTLVVGDRDFGSSQFGGVHVFARSGAGFAPAPFQTLPLPPSSSEFGASVSISQDGNTLVVGDWNYFYTVGGVHLYVRTGGAFAAAPAQTLTGPAGSRLFGYGVALSQDGSTLYVGDADFGHPGGAVHAFSR